MAFIDLRQVKHFSTKKSSTKSPLCTVTYFTGNIVFWLAKQFYFNINGQHGLFRNCIRLVQMLIFKLLTLNFVLTSKRKQPPQLGSSRGHPSSWSYPENLTHCQTFLYELNEVVVASLCYSCDPKHFMLVFWVFFFRFRVLY